MVHQQVPRRRRRSKHECLLRGAATVLVSQPDDAWTLPSEMKVLLRDDRVGERHRARACGQLSRPRASAPTNAS